MGDRESVLETAGVSRETASTLDAFVGLLVKWQASINLVGPKTIDEIWTRHILDSLQVVPLIPSDVRHVLDLGSGAGLPGIVIGIRLKEMGRGRATLVESNGKKVAFLRIAALQLGLPVTVVQNRIEAAMPVLENVDCITARALAPIDQLIRWTAPLLKTGAIGLFHKGRDLDKELAEASICWAFDHARTPSVVEANSWIVEIRNVRPRSEPT